MPLGLGPLGTTVDPNDDLRRLFLELISKGSVGSLKAPAARYGSVEASRLPSAPANLATPGTAVGGYAPGDITAGPGNVIESLIGRGGATGGGTGVSTAPITASAATRIPADQATTSPASTTRGDPSGPTTGVAPSRMPMMLPPSSSSGTMPPRSIIEMLLEAMNSGTSGAGPVGPIGPQGPGVNLTVAAGQDGYGAS
jgi:hypothetical protein